MKHAVMIDRIQTGRLLFVVLCLFGSQSHAQFFMDCNDGRKKLEISFYAAKLAELSADDAAALRARLPPAMHAEISMYVGGIQVGRGLGSENAKKTLREHYEAHLAKYRKMCGEP